MIKRRLLFDWTIVYHCIRTSGSEASSKLSHGPQFAAKVIVFL